MFFDRFCNFKWLFDGQPMGWTVATVLGNTRYHLGVLRAERGNKHSAGRIRAERLSEAAFSAARAADNERDHGRGERASHFCSRCALGWNERKAGNTRSHSLSSEARRKRHYRGRSPDSQVIAKPARLPIPEETVACYMPVRSLLTVARPCGNLTRFPFHPPPFGERRNLGTLHGYHRREEIVKSVAPDSKHSLNIAPFLPKRLEEGARTRSDGQERGIG